MSTDDPTPDAPPPRRRSAFGNAVGIAARKARTPEKARQSHVLTCPDCGAPREGNDLTCRYCGGKTTE